MKSLSTSIRWYFLLPALLAVLNAANCRDCKIVRRTSKKSVATLSKGGSALSKDLILLSLQKEFDPKNPNDTTNYSGMTMIGSFKALTDSVTNVKGNFEFLLSNGETVIWNNAEASNLGNALMSGYPNTILFNVHATEKQFEPLTRHYITKFNAFNILRTEFDTRAQQELMTIAGCLVKEKNK